MKRLTRASQNLNRKPRAKRGFSPNIERLEQRQLLAAVSDGRLHVGPDGPRADEAALLSVGSNSDVAFQTIGLDATAQASKDLFAQDAIEIAGPGGSADYYGSGNDDPFAEYGIASFRFIKADFGLGDGDTITSINSATYSLTHNDRSFTDGSEVEFWVTTDTFSGDFAGLSFDAALANGINPAQYTTAPVSLGRFPYTPKDGGMVDTFALDFAPVSDTIVAKLNAGEEFSIMIAATVADADITFSGLNNGFDPGNPNLAFSIEFTEGADTAPPRINSLTPADDATEVAPDSDLVIQFHEGVVTGAGSVTIKNVADNADVEVIDVTSTQVVVAGDTVTISPTADFANSTEFYIQVTAGAFEDTSGNDFPGISDATAWNFTVADPDNPPVFADGGPYAVSTNAGKGAIVGDVDADDDGKGADVGVEYAITAGAGIDSSMMTASPGYAITPLFTVGEILSGTTGALNSTTAGDYQPVGILDGIGGFELDDDTVRVFVNHELTNGAGNEYQVSNGDGGTVSLRGARISYFDIDKETRTIVDSGLAYNQIFDRAGNVVADPNQLDFEALQRLCSGSLFEASSFGEGRGLADRIYFAGEESGGGSEFALDVATGNLHAVPAMGRAAWENVTLIDTGNTTHVAFLVGDDRAAAPLLLYVGQKNAIDDGSFLDRNGLAVGKVYVWSSNGAETDPSNFNGTLTGLMTPVNGTWVEIDVFDVARAGTEGYDALGYADQSTQDALSDAAGHFEFSRPEDLATDPNDATRAVMASTGRGSLYPADDWGTTYLISTDFTDIENPTAAISIVYDGDMEGNRDSGMRSPDNLDWADDGFIYIQEDRSTSIGTFGGDSGREASIWKLDPATGAVELVAEMNRDAVLPLGSSDPAPTDIGNWESSGILDVSTLFGEAPGTLFIFDVQAHSLRDGIIADAGLVQGGQLSLLEVTDTPAGAFSINSNSGLIVLENPAALVDGDTHTLTVQAYDGVNSSFSTVTVNVNSDAVAAPTDVRVATFNASLNRPAAGGLISDLSTPDNAQAQAIAEIIQTTNPDVVLINEFDYDTEGVAAGLFQENYLGVGQNGADPVVYPYVFNAASNTGVPSGLDLDNNGSVGGGNDAFGFGTFPGQFGMVLFSKYPILEDQVRTFQNFLWKDMPGALLPADPADADGNGDLANWYTQAELDAVRLSSKSHWDVPIDVNGLVVHALASHPTPPVFDGPEDRNGTRNHDEIRFWSDYVTPGAGGYIYDDAEYAAAGDTTPAAPNGGLAAGANFVILGDLNADPNDGDSTNNAALQVLTNPNVNASVTPASVGGVEAAVAQGGLNATHTGDPAFDTGDFNDGSPGNLRVDYALPSAGLDVVDAGVFWPAAGEPLADTVGASDHRLVYVDISTNTERFGLQILHASDLEGGVDAVADAPNFAAVVQALETDAADDGIGTITLSAGDNFIPGPFFNAAGDRSLRETLQGAYQGFFGEAGLTNIREGVGRVDVSVMNIIGFDAAAVGNHEFDAGPSTFSDIIGTDIRGTTLGDVRWLGAQFPYLSANLDFSTEGSLAGLATTDILPSTAFQSLPGDLAAAGAAPKLAPATIIDVDGELVGVVGATTQVLDEISSPGGTTIIGGSGNDMETLAGILNPVIADLAAQTNKIVLVSHLQQISLEQELAGLLNGVDVIVAGGSDTLLADGDDRLRAGDNAGGNYPLLSQNADGDAVAIVSTAGEYSYVGRLVVEFSADGRLIPSSIDAAESGAFATDADGVTALWGTNDAFAADTKGGKVKVLTDAVQTVVTDKDSQIFGKTDVFLEGRRTNVRTEETNLGNLTADANLAAARVQDATVQVSLKNGGGIRAVIGSIDGDTGEELPPAANPLAGKAAGEISQLDIENALRFNNQLTIMTVTAAQLEQLIEHSVAASAPGATPGQFPQVGGVAFSFDPSLPGIEFDAAGTVVTDGERVRSLVIVDDAGEVVDTIVEDGVVVGDPARPIRLVTLNFLAGGGDGYPFDDFGTNVVETGIGEQQALAEYLTANFADTPFNISETSPGLDARIQNIGQRLDTVVPITTSTDLRLEQVGTIELGGAEIAAYDPETQTMVVTGGSLQFVDVSDPANPTLIGTINADTMLGLGTDSFTSVAVKNGIVAAALPAPVEQDPGQVLLFTTAGALIGSVGVGALPDMLTFTPDGSKILVANEGEADDTDPEGSVSVIDVSGVRRGVFGFGFSTVTVETADFKAFDGREDELRNRGVRIFPGKTVSEDVEPEYIAVAPDGTSAFVALQENNAVAVLDIESATIVDLLPLGVKDHYRGQASVETFLIADQPIANADGAPLLTPTGQTVNLGGFSGLHFVGETDGIQTFVTVPDRGPNPETYSDNGVTTRPFALPDYQARIVEIVHDTNTGETTIGDQTFLRRSDGNGGFLPITGRSNFVFDINNNQVDEAPVDTLGNPLELDPFGGDLEGIVINPADGSYWMVDEYRPAVYHFDSTGLLINRFIPEGTAALAGQPAGTFGTETIPSEYVNRRRNRGFEAVALDTEGGKLYAFIQTPLANPDRATSDASDVIRILELDVTSGEPTAEYVYLLEDVAGGARPGGRVDKIGDAVFMGNGKMTVIERDAAVGPHAKKLLFEIDLTGATNVLETDFGASTLEAQTAAQLAELGIQPVNKVKVANLPSIGYQAGDKPEGLTLLPNGDFAVLNDNDFQLADVDIFDAAGAPLFNGGVVFQENPTPIALGILSFDGGNRIDSSDRDDAINPRNQPVYGMFMPDAIAAYEANGMTYYITANEGDARSEDERIKDLTLDPTAFPNAEMLQDDLYLGRLEASSIDGDVDGDGDIDRLHVYGGRSFSIWDEFGNQVFDSGDQIATITANLTPELFNANDGDPEEFDNRSDNKGAEPEGVTVGQIAGRTMAFVGLERAGGGVMVYDVTDPLAPEFLQYIRHPGDISPEGLVFVSAEDSPTGQPMLAVSNEDSNTLTLFGINFSGNNAPVLVDPGPQNLAASEDTRDVTLAATDTDGNELSYSATAETAEYYYDQLLGLNFTGNFFENFSGTLNEKWLQGDDGTWYHITPDGSFWEWLGGGASNRVLVTELSPAAHENPVLLYDAQPGLAPAVVSINGTTLTIDPEDGFVGTFVVDLSVSDGFSVDSMPVFVTVNPNAAPELTNPGPQTMPTTQDTLDVALEATDADGDALTFTATTHSAEYALDQTLGLNLNGDLFLNFGGLDEKWVQADDGTWYYLTPDGGFWRWFGGSAVNAELVAQLDAATYENPILLYEAQPGGGPDGVATVDGSTLTLNPAAGFVGIFGVEVTVSDGSLTDSVLFFVDVTAAPAPGGTLPTNLDAADLADNVPAANSSGNVLSAVDEFDPAPQADDRFASDADELFSALDDSRNGRQEADSADDLFSVVDLDELIETL